MKTYTWSEFNAALGVGIDMTAEAAEQETTEMPFPVVRAIAETHLANIAWPWELAGVAAPAPEDTPTAFTAEQISQAINGAVDEAAEREGGCANDRDNLLVNAVLALLEDPDADLGDVAESCYGEDADTIAAWARDAA
ncbi:hypothetical protein ACIQC7_18610 [Kitasatospora sp. NPDC088556]|uniref:hypothetical protein n=1 Tax=Kitasatospora sp. NPDC088556 TaxID=3364076 RepID=UPI0038301C11